jgi:hypothetical protein
MPERHLPRYLNKRFQMARNDDALTRYQGRIFGCLVDLGE